MRQVIITGLGEEVKTVEDLFEKKKSYKNAFLAAVYKNPDDCPGYVVCRLFVQDKPTPYYIKRRSVLEIQHEFEGTGAVWFERAEGDDQKLVGAYLL